LLRGQDRLYRVASEPCGALSPIGVSRMARQKRRCGSRPPGALEELDEAIGVDPSCPQTTQSVLVRLCFLLPTEAERQQRVGNTGITRAAKNRREAAPGRRRNDGALDDVAVPDMLDLVCQHTRQFLRRPGLLQKAVVYIDARTERGERVNRITTHDTDLNRNSPIGRIERIKAANDIAECVAACRPRVTVADTGEGRVCHYGRQPALHSPRNMPGQTRQSRMHSNGEPRRKSRPNQSFTLGHGTLVVTEDPQQVENDNENKDDDAKRPALRAPRRGGAGFGNADGRSPRIGRVDKGFPVLNNRLWRQVG
jgi:hypothetical protein